MLNKLSCAARLHHMYVVVNLPEIEYYTTEEDPVCLKDLTNYYNTNVVFNREGRIIARYKIKQTLLPGPGLTAFVYFYGVP